MGTQHGWRTFVAQEAYSAMNDLYRTGTAILLALWAVGCAPDDGRTQSHKGQNLTPAYASLEQTCESSGGTQSVCLCVMERMQAEYPDRMMVGPTQELAWRRRFLDLSLECNGSSPIPTEAPQRYFKKWPAKDQRQWMKICHNDRKICTCVLTKLEHLYPSYAALSDPTKTTSQNYVLGGQLGADCMMGR